MPTLKGLSWCLTIEIRIFFCVPVMKHKEWEGVGSWKYFIIQGLITIKTESCSSWRLGNYDKVLYMVSLRESTSLPYNNCVLSALKYLPSQHLIFVALL